MKRVFLILGILLLSSILMSNSAQPIELKFSHKLHTIDEDMECSDCHESAAISLSGSDNLLPDMETCGDCHDIEEEENCSTCHSNVDEPASYPTIESYLEKFPHKKHIEKGYDCRNCHEPVTQKTAIGSYVLPNMAFCMDCHQNNGASTECLSCHQTETSLIPVSHTLDFKHHHSDLAQSENPAILNNKKCSTCHNVNFCQDCHEGDNLDRTTHPLNYQFTHSLDAQSKQMDCSTCHTDRMFCLECHRDNNIMPHNHTPGWVNQIPDDGGRHKFEAEVDLESCMACHEQNASTICQPCHGNKINE